MDLNMKFLIFVFPVMYEFQYSTVTLSAVKYFTLGSNFQYY